MKKTLDQLTDEDIGKKVTTLHWSGYLAHYMPRVTEASAYGLVTTIDKGKLTRYAVNKNDQLEIDD